MEINKAILEESHPPVQDIDQNSQEEKVILLSDENHQELVSNERPYNIGFIIQITLIVALGGFIFGYDTGIIGGAALYFDEDFPYITNEEKETIVSLAIIGAAVGCLIMGPISDNFGRKMSMITGDIIFMIGAFFVRTQIIFY